MNIDQAIEMVGEFCEVFFNDSRVPLVAYLRAYEPCSVQYLEDSILSSMLWEFCNPHRTIIRLKRFKKLRKVRVAWRDIVFEQEIHDALQTVSVEGGYHYCVVTMKLEVVVRAKL